MRYALNYISKKHILFIFFFLIIAFFFSCTHKELTNEKPKIEFLADSNCLYTDTILPMGSIMKFKIKATDKNAPITNFVIKYNNCVEHYFLDTGIYNTEFFYSLEIIKGNAAHEEWKFFVMNKNRQSSEVSLSINLDTGAVFAQVKSYDITLGAQNNNQFGHFFSFSNEVVYTLEEAYNNQQYVDISYCYYTESESTLSSPNDNDASTIFTGAYGISNWQIRNESRYNLTSLSPSAFENVLNDSLLIASYDITGAKRKGKNIVPGQVWAFRIQSGKIGLIMVENIITGTTGLAELKIKIQE
jgi:hypothetical protein